MLVAESRRALDGRRWWALLLLIFAVGLAVRLTYVGFKDTKEVERGDAVYYHVGANIFADGDGFPHPILAAFEFRRVPGADHPPGYIVYLSVASVFGFRSVFAHQVWSALLGASTILLVGIVARRLMGPRLALLAAALAALSPNIWMTDAWVLSETLAIFLTVLFLYCAYRCWDTPTPVNAAFLGVSIGAAAMSRSELLALAFVVPLLFWYRRRVAPKPLVAIVVAGIGCAAVIAPWAIYNLGRFEGERVVLSNQLDRTMAASWCDDGFYGKNLGYKSYECLRDRGRTARAEPDQTLDLQWKTYARAHMDRVPVAILARVGRTWNAYRPFQQRDYEGAFTDNEGPLATLALYATWLLIPAAVVGVFRLRARRVPVFPLLAVPLVVTLSAAMTFGQLRYRAPAEPVLVILAAAAFLPLRRRQPEQSPAIAPTEVDHRTVATV